MQAASARSQSLESLVCAMAAGDEAALSLLYQQTVARVFAIARGVLRSKEDAEECDVFTHAWLRASSFDVDRGSVLAWLTVMARNRALDRLRQRRELASLDDERPGADAGSLAVGYRRSART
jgi:RNA polymerase sigma-70 factor, ECF subfamily